jgi:hypothetical protein
LEFVSTPDVNPKKDDDSTWNAWHNLFLSGKSGISRFYLMHREIGVGDMEIKGGKPKVVETSNRCHETYTVIRPSP